MSPQKPSEAIAARFQVSPETAKYFLNSVQKGFKTERPSHQVIVDYMAEETFDMLPEAQDVALMMKESGAWDHELSFTPLLLDEEADPAPAGKRKKSTLRSQRKVCPHGVPLTMYCANCELDELLKK